MGIGDIVVGSPEWASGEEFFAFAGISPARFRILPIAQQFAEKVHSYTLPRKTGINSRVKDLVDLVLILDKEAPLRSSIKPAIEATFIHRSTHDIPVTIPAAPPTWTSSFTAMAKQVNISETTIEGAVARVNHYLERYFLDTNHGTSKEKEHPTSDHRPAACPPSSSPPATSCARTRGSTATSTACRCSPGSCS